MFNFAAVYKSYIYLYSYGRKTAVSVVELTTSWKTVPLGAKHLFYARLQTYSQKALKTQVAKVYYID